MALYGFGFLIGIALTAIVWFLFVVPMERDLHRRKMELMKQKLARNEERLRELRESNPESSKKNTDTQMNV